MRTSTAASLVGAAILSTSIFPLVGLRLRGDRAAHTEAPEATSPDAPAASTRPAGQEA
jgi:hypothetical protein